MEDSLLLSESSEASPPNLDARCLLGDRAEELADCWGLGDAGMGRVGGGLAGGGTGGEELADVRMSVSSCIGLVHADRERPSERPVSNC